MVDIIVCSGGFDPIHSGHIKLLKEASEGGDMLVVGVNSDAWLSRKKGAPFMSFDERLNIVASLAVVDHAFGFDDTDGSASAAIQWVLDTWPEANVIMSNGGDRTEGNIPEMDAFKDNPRVRFVFGIGGTDKANSSSWILNEWKSPKTTRPWGYYRKLHQDGPGTHVKELELSPGKQISMQRHRQRSELWVVTTGKATVITAEIDLDNTTEKTYTKHELITIPVGTWHQLLNQTDEIVKIVEVQYGSCCMEEDIERVGVSEGYGASLYQK